MSADGSRTFDGKLEGYQAPYVTVLKLDGYRMTFDESILCDEDRYYCRLAGRVLNESFYNIPLFVVQYYDLGVLCQPYGAGFYRGERIFIKGKNLSSQVALGKEFTSHIYRAGTTLIEEGQGARSEVRAFMLSLDEAVLWAYNNQPPPDLRKEPASAPPSTPPKPSYSISYGSGFAITSNGWVATNEHVIRDADSVQIHHNGKMAEAKVMYVDAVNDLALLKTEAATIPLVLSLSEPVKLGEEITVGGFPNPEVQGSSLKLTRGIISSMKGIKDDVRHYQIDAAAQPGNSGGPIVDTKGRVVGILVSKLNDLTVLKESGAVPQNVNYGIKVAYLFALIQEVDGLQLLVEESDEPEGELIGEILGKTTYQIICRHEN